MRILNQHLKAEINTSKWFYVPAKRKRPEFRLFCFHYAGVSAEVFHSWSVLFPDNIELCAIQLPGRSTRLNEKRITEMAVLAEKVAKEIQNYNELPFLFFGHCMGAYLSYEVVRVLSRNACLLPSHLFVSAAKAPFLPILHPDLHRLSDDDFLLMMKEINLRPDTFYLSPGIIEESLPIIKSDFALVEKWSRPGEDTQITIPITALGGDKDEFVLEEHVKKWAVCTTASFNYSIFPGGHFYLQEGDNHESIIRWINETIDNLQKKR